MNVLAMKCHDDRLAFRTVIDASLGDPTVRHQSLSSALITISHGVESLLQVVDMTTPSPEVLRLGRGDPSALEL
jgi:hypothetical protein